MLPPLPYCPSLAYFKTHILDAEKLIINANIAYNKQFHLNYCIINHSNGLLKLSIPLLGGRHQKSIIKDIKIDHRQSWVKQHIRSLQSAYNNSPWFKWYESELIDLYAQKTLFLMDWNLSLLEWLLKHLNIRKDIILSQDDIPIKHHAKALPEYFPYYPQVFTHHNLIPAALSMYDLLFNLGKQSIVYFNNIVL